MITVVAAGVFACGSSGPTSPSPLPPEAAALAPPPPSGAVPPVSAAGAVTATLVGAGDLSQCGLEGVVLTGRLMESMLGRGDVTAITLGDNSNDDGSQQKYECFDRWWGQFRNVLYPVPGNHDYEAEGANAYYYRYFPNAGPRGLGYYSYNRGNWHIVALNSELEESARPAQLSWLDGDLKQYQTSCTLAYFHRPLFSSGQFAAARMKRIWDVLYRNGIDVVLNGHEHFYAAFPQLRPDGSLDPQFGIRQIIAGTGGARLFAAPMATMGERVIGGTWGLLRMTLRPGGYSWDFVSIDGSVLDHGDQQCHAAPPAI